MGDSEQHMKHEMPRFLLATLRPILRLDFSAWPCLHILVANRSFEIVFEIAGANREKRPANSF